jgi:hypothetical protein
MGPHQAIVSAALMAKSSAQAPAKARWEVRPDAAPVSMLRQIRRSKVFAREVISVILQSPFFQ